MLQCLVLYLSCTCLVPLSCASLVLVLTLPCLCLVSVWCLSYLCLVFVWPLSGHRLVIAWSFSCFSFVFVFVFIFIVVFVFVFCLVLVLFVSCLLLSLVVFVSTVVVLLLPCLCLVLSCVSLVCIAYFRHLNLIRQKVLLDKFLPEKLTSLVPATIGTQWGDTEDHSVGVWILTGQFHPSRVWLSSTFLVCFGIVFSMIGPNQIHIGWNSWC